MNILVDFLHDPRIARAWDVGDWNTFQPQARNARLLGRCWHLFDEYELTDVVPQRLLDQLQGALTQTRYVQGQALREWRHVRKVLGAEGIDVMPLKGLAYLVGDLPPARWRNMSDIDVLVPVDDIARAEQVLQRTGWVSSGEFDDYDVHYYRDWMHEVPPLRHAKREVEVDLHHNLAPPVSRVRIEASQLWRASEDISDSDGNRQPMLAATDLLLHNAVHLFMNDELRGGLRDVVDFRDLLVHFRDRHSDFDEQLLARANALGCGRALYYAATTARRLTGVNLSPRFIESIASHAPPAPVRGLMTQTIDRVLVTTHPSSVASRFADQLLYLRSHWIRMPPGMLLRHLGHKWLKRRKGALTASDLPG